MKFILYYHKNKPLAQYVKKFSLLSELERRGECESFIRSLPQQNKHEAFAELPSSMRKLLFYAKPDLVICMDNGVQPVRPIFAFEESTHVPARDHWMQRFVNLVGCAQEGVPGAYIMPFSMPTREKFKGEIDPFFFFAYDRVMEIHQTPFYIAEWKSTDGQTLDRDQEFPTKPDHNSEGLRNTFNFLEMVLDSAIHGRNFSDLMRERLFVDLRNQIRNRAYSVEIPKIADFDRLSFNMRSNDFLSFSEMRRWIVEKGIHIPENMPDRIIKRKRNLIFVPQSDRAKKTSDELRSALLYRIKSKGGDPYMGQPLTFDYIFCRLGTTPYERDANLIIDLSIISFSDLAEYHRQVWSNCPLKHIELSSIKHIPQYTMYLKECCPAVEKNFLRVYAFAADIIVFKEGLIYF